MLDKVVDDRVTTKVQTLDAFLKIVVSTVRKQRPIPPFCIRRDFELRDAWN
jgi:hypothetical protein